MARKRADAINASELAQSTVCEQQAVFDRTVGRSYTRESRIAIDRGRKEHARMHREATGIMQAEDRRCFIASAVFGEDAPECDALRDWRDRFLLSRVWGIWLVRIYYLLSPSVAIVVEALPPIQIVVRAALRAFVQAIVRR